MTVCFHSKLSLIFCLILLGAPTAAHCQIEAYVTYSPAHLSNVETGAVATATGYTEKTASYWSSGVGGGVTLPILRLPVVSLNVDLRGSTRPGTNGVDSALFGLKLAVHPHVIPFKPYIQVSGGYLDTRTTNVSTTSTNGQSIGGTFDNKYAAYEVMGGVDYPLIPFVDFRIIEVGAGQGIGFDSRNAIFVTVNTGLVIHF